MSEQRRLAAILVADVVGYSRLVGTDEAGTVAKLGAMRRDLIDPAVQKHAGRLFKAVGDGFLVEFASAVQAVTCAVEIQTANHTFPLRIGIHVGDVIVQGDDLLGDGVNIAARVEGVAEPGGIAISRAVHEQVRDKLDLKFVDKGQVELKNLVRPVRVFAFAGTKAAEPPALTLPDKPSIAVLPFQNMSGDSEQEYFVDGLVEDIITALSRFRQLFVIARNSSFAYKGRSPDVRQVARELGVRYALEGSIRRSGNRIRVTGQLIDAATGSHVWAESYDRDLQDVFEVQEELTRAIVGALVPQMEGAEFLRHMRLRPASLAAHELVYRAFAQAIEGYNRSNGPLCDAAIETARKALAMDSSNSQAWAVVCFALTQHLLYARRRDVEQVRAEALMAGTRAIEADPLNHAAFTTRGIFQCNNGRFAAGLQDLRRACALNPNDATALFCLGYFQAMNGDAEDGMASIKQAIRLSPKDVWRPTMHQNLAFACAVAKRYAEGVEAALVARSEAPAMLPGFITLAVNYVGLGEIQKARRVVEEARVLSPEHVELRLKTGWGCQRPEDAERLKSFMRIAAGVERPNGADSATLSLPDKPSIAVLPFQNMSGDPEQEYFVDGLVEDIITALSRFKTLFVIARNSSFTYKGRAVDIKQVGRELGVRYVLEGSVRKAGGRVRVTGQLIDSQTGAHLWADRFDGALEDVFELQDRIAAAVVGHLPIAMQQAEIERLRTKPTANLAAYDEFLLGLKYVYLSTRESMDMALKHFYRAIDLDPAYVEPHVWAAVAYSRRRQGQWMVDVRKECAEGVRLARRGVELGPDHAHALSALGFSLAFLAAETAAGIDFLDRALSLNSNDAQIWHGSGWVRCYNGEPDLAIEHIGRAERLSPLDPQTSQFHLAKSLAHFCAGRYEESASVASQIIARHPDLVPAYNSFARAAAMAGRMDEAREAMNRAVMLNPDLKVSTMSALPIMRRPGDRERLIQAYRLAGMPE